MQLIKNSATTDNIFRVKIPVESARGGAAFCSSTTSGRNTGSRTGTAFLFLREGCRRIAAAPRNATDIRDGDAAALPLRVQIFLQFTDKDIDDTVGRQMIPRRVLHPKARKGLDHLRKRMNKNYGLPRNLFAIPCSLFIPSWVRIQALKSLASREATYQAHAHGKTYYRILSETAVQKWDKDAIAVAKDSVHCLDEVPSNIGPLSLPISLISLPLNRNPLEKLRVACGTKSFSLHTTTPPNHVHTPHDHTTPPPAKSPPPE